MGYRWECNNCNFITWDENSRKDHEKETQHILWGGSKVWSHPDGDYFKWLKK